MTSSLERGPDRCPNAVPQHSSRGSPKTVHKKRGRFSSLASFRPSLTSVSQGICCHLFAAADGLMTAASLVSSGAAGPGFLASAAWPCAPSATARMKLVSDIILPPLCWVMLSSDCHEPAGRCLRCTRQVNGLLQDARLQPDRASAIHHPGTV